MMPNFWQLALTLVLKNHEFPLSMLSFRQKSFFFCIPRLKTQQPILTYYPPYGFTNFQLLIVNILNWSLIYWLFSDQISWQSFWTSRIQEFLKACGKKLKLKFCMNRRWHLLDNWLEHQQLWSRWTIIWSETKASQCQNLQFSWVQNSLA